MAVLGHELGVDCCCFDSVVDWKMLAMTYEDKIKYNVKKIRPCIEVLVRNGHSRFDEFAVFIAENRPSFYLRSRWQLEEIWNKNTTMCHAEIATHGEVVRGVEKADSILVGSGHIALKHHVLPKDPSEHPLPFFFLELGMHKAYPKLVVACQGVFREAAKQYMLPVKLPSAVAQASFASLRPYVPVCTWEYLLAILGTLNIIFEIKSPRNSVAGDCKLDIIGGIARVTINASSNKWKFLCTVLHEISHALNPSRYSPHDAYWKSIYSTLLADFYNFFPDEYKSEVAWGMVYTPASLRSTNFYGRAVLFGISDVLTEDGRRKNLLDLQKLNLSESVKDSFGITSNSGKKDLAFDASKADAVSEDLGKYCELAARLVKIYLDKGVGDFKTLVCLMSKDYPRIFPTVKPSLDCAWNYAVRTIGLPDIVRVDEETAQSIYAEIENGSNVHENSDPSLVLQTGISKDMPSLILKGDNVSGFSIHKEDIAPFNLPYDFSYRSNTFVEQYESRLRFEGQLYIPIDLKADQRFFRFLDKLPIRTQNVVWNLYAREYGDGAYRYARNVEYDWKDGTVRGWAAGRFFDIVPIVFPLPRKKELFKTILDASDSMRTRQLCRRDFTPKQVLLSISDFAAKSPLVIHHLQSFGTKEACEFDYDKIYDFSSWSIPLWMKQSDIESYRRELATEKKKRISALVNEVEGMVKQLKDEFLEYGQASLTIDFPSKSFNIRIVSSLRGMIHKMALILGLTKDFI